MTVDMEGSREGIDWHADGEEAPWWAFCLMAAGAAALVVLGTWLIISL